MGRQSENSGMGGIAKVSLIVAGLAGAAFLTACTHECAKPENADLEACQAPAARTESNSSSSSADKPRKSDDTYQKAWIMPGTGMR